MTDSKENQRFASVWDAVCESPEEAASLRLRSSLLARIAEKVREFNLSHQEVGLQLGIDRSLVESLLNGHIEAFELDSLVKMATRVGFRVGLSILD